jgi:hypothetical protein
MRYTGVGGGGGREAAPPQKENKKRKGMRGGGEEGKPKQGLACYKIFPHWQNSRKRNSAATQKTGLCAPPLAGGGGGEGARARLSREVDEAL